MSQFYDLYINGKIGTMQDLNISTNVSSEQLKNKRLPWLLQLVTEFHKGVKHGSLAPTDPLVSMKEKTRYTIHGKSFILVPSTQAALKIDKALAVSKGEEAEENVDEYNGVMYCIMERMPNGSVEYVGRSRDERAIIRKLMVLDVKDIKTLELDHDYHVYKWEEDEETGDVTQVSDEPIRTFFVFKVDNAAKEFKTKLLQVRNHIRANALDIEAKRKQEALRAAENRKKKRLETQTGHIDISDSAHGKTLNNIGNAFENGTELTVRNGAFKSTPIRIKNDTVGVNMSQLGLIIVKNGKIPSQLMTFNHNIVAYKGDDGQIYTTDYFPDSTVWETIKLKLNAKPM